MIAALTALGCTSPARPTGEALFTHAYTPAEGLGPLYNRRACVDCHAHPTIGGVGPDQGLDVAFRIGFLDANGFTDLSGRGGPVAREHSVSELGEPCALRPGIPAAANVVSTRNAPQLFGTGAIDAIADATIVDGAMPRPGGIHGRPNWVVEDGAVRVGRFGWKAQVASLGRFSAEALRTELGVTNPAFPDDLLADGDGCAGFSDAIEQDDDAGELHDFIAALPAPPPVMFDASPGGRVFVQVGCAGCHVPALDGVPVFSDLLIHDMGPGLDDKFVQGAATGRDWRTTPLWGLHARPRLLHDGRATSIEDAIRAHDGEAAAAVASFESLSPDDRAALLDILSAL